MRVGSSTLLSPTTSQRLCIRIKSSLREASFIPFIVDYLPTTVVLSAKSIIIPPFSKTCPVIVTVLCKYSTILALLLAARPPVI
jgi:hypothetical protein